MEAQADWSAQQQIADLGPKDVSTVTEHLATSLRKPSCDRIQ
jgi:hypothetical protein